jgi:O-acetyl-ADP-ribose deacetylase (regulator of RNase III)
VTLKYIKGDATCPQASGVKIIAHVCNNIGKWGKGFVLAVSDRWPQTRQEYLKWYNERSQNDFALGAVQFIQVEPYIWVASMVGQAGIKTGSKGAPVRYDAIEQCLGKVREKAKELGASVHMPKIGAGLAGGDWKKIEPIIQKELVDHALDTTVYLFGEEAVQ